MRLRASLSRPLESPFTGSQGRLRCGTPNSVFGVDAFGNRGKPPSKPIQYDNM